MDLVNHTDFPGYLFRTTIDDDRLAASVLIRVTYDLRGEKLIPSDEQVWKVSGTPWESEYGKMEGDEVFRKGGVDFFIFGHARSPNKAPVDQLNVELKAGSFQKNIKVYGDRHWVRQNNKLVPSMPQPFHSIPLTMEYAYGGKIEWDGLKISYSDNPDGIGYYNEEKSAEGKSLPNIEDPNNLIKHWNDQPVPVGVGMCPMENASRIKSNVQFDDAGAVTKLDAKFFNSAFPDMIASNVSPGDRVSLSGVGQTGILEFKLPPSPFITRLKFDNEIIERKLTIDQIGFEVNQRRVFISYRYPFRYVMYPMQKRSCEVFSLDVIDDKQSE